MGKSKVSTEVESDYFTNRVCSIFTITSDESNPKVVLDKMGVCGSKVYKASPKHCPVCQYTKLCTLEVIVIGDDPLFWECDKCGSLHCMKDRGWIEAQIKKLEGCWTNTADWESPEKDDFN